MKRIINILLLCAMMAGPMQLWGEKLFYLSTDKTYGPDELKKIKIESGYALDDIKIRIYRINDLEAFYKSQRDFHKPVVKGRGFAYNSPDVVNGFDGYFRSSLRRWARDMIPARDRLRIMKSYPDFSMKSTEGYYTPDNMVKYLPSDQYTLIREKKYVIEETARDWNYNYIFIDPVDPGTYLVEGISGENIAYTILNVSQCNFIAKKSGSKLVVYLADTVTGVPEGGASLGVFDVNGKRLKSMKTDDNGVAETDLKENKFFILAQCADGSSAFYDPQYFPAESRNRYVYIYTDRPVYKGTDQVYIKGLIRNYKDGSYVNQTSGDTTVSIINPDGTAIQNIKTSITKEGMFSCACVLPEKTQAGRYLITARIGTDQFGGEFKVEYYVKPEFEVSVKPEQSLVIGGKEAVCKVNARYFVGGPVKKGKATYQIYRTIYNDTIQDENDKNAFITEDEYNYIHKELVDSGEFELAPDGTGVVRYQTEELPQAYSYSVSVVVNADNGSIISGGGSFRSIPADLRLHLLTNKFVYTRQEQIEADIEAVDYHDTAVVCQCRVTVSGEGKRGEEITYLDETVKTDANGRATIKFVGEQNGFVRISVKSADSDGNSVNNEKYIWIGENGASLNYQGGMVRLYSDKKYYQVGETAKILMVSPVPEINYLLSIEGDTIYDYKVEKCTGNSALISLPIKSNYVPNIFVDLSYVFNNYLYKNTLKISIPPADRVLHIEPTMDNPTYAPKEKGKVRVRVTDQNGAPVKNVDLSIGVVDEAIYSISQEIAVNINSFFYPERRNNVSSWFSTAFRFYGYSMDAREELSAKYFDTTKGLAAFKEDDKERRDFKDTMFFLPSVTTDNDGYAEAEVTFPDNITKWRITVIGGSQDGKFGRGVGYVVTKLPLYVSIAMPQELDEYDSTTAYLNIFNYTSEELKPALTITGKNLKWTGDLSEVTVAPLGSKVIKLAVKPDAVGTGELAVSVVTPKFKDKVVQPVTVHPHSMEVNVPYTYGINKNSSNVKIFVSSKTKKEGQALYFKLSDNYYTAVSDSLPYLISYPYGCVEQTVSSFLPDLVLLSTLRKTGIKSPAAEQALPGIIDKGLGKIYGYQNRVGGWGWFESTEVNVFMTSYALYALTLTQQYSGEVNTDVLRKGLDCLEKNIGNATSLTEKLYALYVLSLNTVKVQSVYEEVKRTYSSLSDYQLALLTLTALEYKRGDDAKRFADELKKHAKKSGNMVYWGEKEGYSWGTDHIEVTAWCIKALVKLENDQNILNKALSFIIKSDETYKQAADYLLSQKSGKQWKSTRDTASVVYALADVISKKGVTADMQTEYRLSVSGRVVGFLKNGTQDMSGVVTVSDTAFIDLLKKGGDVAVDGLRDNQEYTLTVLYSGYSDGATILSRNSGMGVVRTYYKLEPETAGNVTKYRKSSYTTNFKRGDSVLVELIVSGAGTDEYVCIEDHIPAGTLPDRGFKLYDIEDIQFKDLPDSIAYQSDKVVFFRKKGGEMRFYYVLTPTYPGEYRVLPAVASLMYFPQKTGNTTDTRFSIEGETK